MTREYILQNLEVMCSIIFIDNPGLRDHVMSTLQDSLLIPKPKFKVGDRVKWTSWSNAPEDIIEERLYNPDANMWGYLRSDMETFIDEPELELVEEGR